MLQIVKQTYSRRDVDEKIVVIRKKDSAKNTKQPINQKRAKLTLLQSKDKNEQSYTTFLLISDDI